MTPRVPWLGRAVTCDALPLIVPVCEMNSDDDDYDGDDGKEDEDKEEEDEELGRFTTKSNSPPPLTSGIQPRWG